MVTIESDYEFYELLYDKVQDHHNDLLGTSNCGFVWAIPESYLMGFTQCPSLGLAKAAIQGLSNSSEWSTASFYIVGADIRETVNA